MTEIVCRYIPIKILGKSTVKVAETVETSEVFSASTAFAWQVRRNGSCVCT